ncbi:hypothetical protein F383_14771 [Gossypium arboreum]|uniref:Uncharacterized protein n=1 Tax=Gossypium arboreum TaxID=29729 RepID=A0A0B0NHU9_GOSAR|nr:hypothetical protein F383_14771 [Gossypium arboreum]
MNLDQLNELGCVIYIMNPGQLNEFEFFLIPSDMSLVS